MSKIYEKREAATGYDSARALPEETKSLWMKVLSELVPVDKIGRVLDLGGGTGRFSGMIHDLFSCPVINLDSSVEMLKQGIGQGKNDISQITASAEAIPLSSLSVNLVWMSNVFHHLADPEAAFSEIRRVLSEEGGLVIRNGTQETDTEMLWKRFFPEAIDYDKGRIPYQPEIINAAVLGGFRLELHRMVYQLFASSYEDYFKKISGRGLSALLAISDEAFKTGIERMRAWTSTQTQDRPVFEPVDIFLFRKR